MTACKCQPFKQAIDCPVHPMQVTCGKEAHRLTEACMACRRPEGSFMCMLCAAWVDAEAQAS